MKKSILLVGPCLPPIHGQSLAFTRFVESIDEKSKTIIDTNFRGQSKIGKIVNTCKIIFSIFGKTLFGRYNIIYFTCSRSLLGSIKDVVLINFSRSCNAKLVNHLHGSDFYDFIHNCPGWYRRILLYSYNKVDVSIVLLDSMKSQFKDFKKMEVKTVPNFYDETLDFILDKKKFDSINLLYLSNIMKSKGILNLLEAYDILSKNHANVFLDIAGDFVPDDHMSIKNMKKIFYTKIKKNPKIKFHGVVTGKEKASLLQGSDIFVLPTFYKSEAFPISILEAMRCGNAIVTTDYKYLPEIVKDESGILVETKSTEDLVNGLEGLISDSKKMQKMQQYNVILAKKNYSLSNYIKNLRTIIYD